MEQAARVMFPTYLRPEPAPLARTQALADILLAIIVPFS